MKLIPLTGIRGAGLCAIVSDDDYTLLIGFKWLLHPNGTVYRKEWRENPPSRASRKKPIYMHRQIMGFPDCVVDHKDRNKLNNQRDNLRNADKSLNAANCGKSKGNWSSQYKRVSFNNRTNKWTSAVKGFKTAEFEIESDAARWSNKLAFQKWGEFAWLNPVEPIFP